MNMKNILIGVVVFTTLVSFIGTSEARTLNFNEVFNTEITLTNGERLKVVNTDTISHSITSVVRNGSNTFDSGVIAPTGSTDMGFYVDGDYQIFDQMTNKTGVIHVRTLEPPSVTLDTSLIFVKAGETFNIDGKNLGQAEQVNIEIKKPDGSIHQTLTIFSTSTGTINVPIVTTSTEQNGVYRAMVVGVPQSTTIFVIEGGVTPENPLEVSPTVNETVTAPTASSSSSIGSQTVVPQVTTTGFTDLEKQFMITWLKMQIQILQNMLAELETTN